MKNLIEDLAIGVHTDLKPLFAALGLGGTGYIISVHLAVDCKDFAVLTVQRHITQSQLDTALQHLADNGELESVSSNQLEIIKTKLAELTQKD